MNRNDILEKLKFGKCSIAFVKSDGTLRRMVATLDENITGIEPETSSSSKQNVYDTDIGEWRSFNWANLQIVNGEQVTV